MEIRHVEQLLESYLQKDERLVNFTQDKLLSAGENYGSTMLKVNLLIEDKNGKQKIIKCVAKLVPPKGVLWDMFQTLSTFKKEISVYKTIVPLLNQFGKEHNIKCILPFFAEHYNSRVTLNPNSNDVDDDAIILMENLQEKGYKLENRFVGFDKNAVIMIIKSLATLHATTIAYKRAKPEEFQNKVLAHIGKCFVSKINEQTKKLQLDCFMKFLENYPKLHHLSERMISGYRRGINSLCQNRTPNELFGTFIHGDLWTNNILTKTIHENLTSIKLLDFQVAEYGNPGRDVIFFLYTSAQMELLQFVDDFLLIYYNHFIDILKTLNCDSTPFTFDAFLQQVGDAAKETEFGRCLFFIHPVFTEKGKAVELKDIKTRADIVPSLEHIHPNGQIRFSLIIEDFAKRGWI
nr:uncharacterized protein LOC111418972 [Onthophagus taurus]XP_022907464.1 uncharacterized protein LOC111418972 [Onthophagus taurus]